MRFLLAALAVAAFCQPARADNCTESLDYILNDLAGELPLPSSAYQRLLDVCQQTLTISNVKHAYLLKDGGIAVAANDNSVFATARTLADFCRTFPRGRLRFITRQESRRGLTTGFVVLMSSSNSDSCQEIREEK